MTSFGPGTLKFLGYIGLSGGGGGMEDMGGGMGRRGKLIGILGGTSGGLLLVLGASKKR